MFAPITGTPPARHSATTSGAQSHQSDGITAASRPDRIPGSSACEKAPASSTTPRRSSAKEPLGERGGYLSVDADADRAVGELRSLDEQLRALVRVRRADEADGERVTDPARPAGAADRLPDRAVLGHRLLHDVDHRGREAEPEQRAAHRLGDGEDAVDPQREPLAQLGAPLLVARGVTRADAGGAAAAGVPRSVAEREVLAEEVVPCAAEPVVVGREDGADAARERLVDERQAEVVQVVQVHHLRVHAIEQGCEGGPDRGVVELAMRVSEIEQAVRPVVHRDHLDAVLDRRADGVGRLVLEPRDARGEHGHVVAPPGELLGHVAGHDGAAAGVGEAERREHDTAAGRAARGGPGQRGRPCSARAPVRRKLREPLLLEDVGEREARAALGVGTGQHRPVEARHQVVERPVRERSAQQGLELGRLDCGPARACG